MVGLVDIAPVSKTVPVRGSEVDIHGVSAAGIAYLFNRFPDLKKMVVGRDLTVEKIMEIGGDLVAAIIAAGTGKPGDKATEDVAVGLPFGEQWDLVWAIWEATAPNGHRPFMAKLEALGVLGSEAPASEPVAAPATKSPKGSRS